MAGIYTNISRLARMTLLTTVLMLLMAGLATATDIQGKIEAAQIYQMKQVTTVDVEPIALGTPAGGDEDPFDMTFVPEDFGNSPPELRPVYPDNSKFQLSGDMLELPAHFGNSPPELRPVYPDNSKFQLSGDMLELPAHFGNSPPELRPVYPDNSKFQLSGDMLELPAHYGNGPPRLRPVCPDEEKTPPQIAESEIAPRLF